MHSPYEKTNKGLIVNNTVGLQTNSEYTATPPPPLHWSWYIPKCHATEVGRRRREGAHVGWVTAPCNTCKKGKKHCYSGKQLCVCNHHAFSYYIPVLLYTDNFHGRSLSVLLDSLLSKSCCRLTKSEEFIGSSFIYVDVL